MEPVTFVSTVTTNFFYKTNLLAYIFGLPNFWIQELKLPTRFIKIYDSFNYISNIAQGVLILSEFGGYLTQKNLTEKQRVNLFLYAIAHAIMYLNCLIIMTRKNKVQKVLYQLTKAFKEIHNDLEVEKKFIHKTKMYLIALLFSFISAVFMITIRAYIDMIYNNVTFTPTITAYPDMMDRSNLANAARVVNTIVIWLIAFKSAALFCLVIPLASGLSHQFENLQSYFYSLSKIFKRNDLDQKEQEELFEKQFKVGIQFHRDTLRSTELTQTILSEVFSGQIIFNVLILMLLMAQMVKSDRTLVNLSSTLLTSSAVLISTGFFMWNAGDITVEASKLSTAIFLSGWHNCEGSSAIRVGKLVVIAINRAQVPVVLKGLGYIELSYQSYLSIVKSSYSAFSVLF